jgi:hypothetical protein
MEMHCDLCWVYGQSVVREVVVWLSVLSDDRVRSIDQKI